MVKYPDRSVTVFSNHCNIVSDYCKLANYYIIIIEKLKIKIHLQSFFVTRKDKSLVQTSFVLLKVVLFINNILLQYFSVFNQCPLTTYR